MRNIYIAFIILFAFPSCSSICVFEGSNIYITTKKNLEDTINVSIEEEPEKER